MGAICIWCPKYKTSEVLVDVSKVTSGKNYVFFAADGKRPDLYSFTSEQALSCKKTSNGKIMCYCIPLEYLVNEGELPEALVPIRDYEYKKFKQWQDKSKKNKK